MRGRIVHGYGQLLASHRRPLTAVFVVLALLCQSLLLFAPDRDRTAALADDIALSMAAAGAHVTVWCGSAHEQDHGTPIHHHGAGDCPLCCTFGHALGPAAPTIPIAARVAGTIDPVISSEAPARSLKRLAGRPRGPPLA